jgi:hypothetical protein
MDAVNHKGFSEKMRWAVNFWDQGNRKFITPYGMRRVIAIMDQVIIIWLFY